MAPRGPLWLFEPPAHHACFMINCKMFKSSSKTSATKTRGHATNTEEEEKKPPTVSCILMEKNGNHNMWQHSANINLYTLSSKL